MSKGAKKLVKIFYSSGFQENREELKNFLHPEVELYWNSSAGFNKMGFSEILDLSSEMAKAFDSLRIQVSHLLKDKDQVVIRFTYYAKTVENPDEELPMAHFIAIWEVKEGKLYKGYQISQQADESPDNLSSFLGTNF